jgi:hypothetical protein
MLKSQQRADFIFFHCRSHQNFQIDCSTFPFGGLHEHQRINDSILIHVLIGARHINLNCYSTNNVFDLFVVRQIHYLWKGIINMNQPKFGIPNLCPVLSTRHLVRSPIPSHQIAFGLTAFHKKAERKQDKNSASPPAERSRHNNKTPP